MPDSVQHNIQICINPGLTILFHLLPYDSHQIFNSTLRVWRVLFFCELVGAAGGWEVKEGVGDES